MFLNHTEFFVKTKASFYEFKKDFLNFYNLNKI